MSDHLARNINWARKRVYEGLNNRLRLAGDRWAKFCRPVSIMFLLTELCNARCLHCDIWKNKGREAAPTVERLKEVVSEIRSWIGPMHLVFTGGEALLKPYATELVAHATSVGLFPELLTHGYWPDQKRIEELALARPWRVTISLDGLGKTHSSIRGREDFFERTSVTIKTLQRMRAERGLDYAILLKHVIMEHNLGDTVELAKFAARENLEIFYQPIEQNYNTPENPAWFRESENWPKDSDRAIANVKELIAMKREGYPISNSLVQLEVIADYFAHPEGLLNSTRAHTAHERRKTCSALGMLQIHANGDVRVCSRKDSVGNIKDTSLRAIWANRPQFWLGGCCQDDCSAEPNPKLAVIEAGS